MIKVIIDGVIYDISNRSVNTNLSSSIVGNSLVKQGNKRLLPVTLPLSTHNASTQKTPQQWSTSEDQYEGLLALIVEVEGMEILNGYAKRNTVETNKNTGTIQVEGWDKNADWTKELNRTLDLFAPADFLWDDADIDAVIAACGIDNPYDAGFDRCYPAIMYAPNALGNWLYETMLPAIPVLSLLERFFGSIQPIGYTIVSNFLYSDFFKRLILPFCWGRFGNRDNNYQIQNTDFKASITTVWYGSTPPAITPDSFILHFDDDSTSPNFDNALVYNTATGEFTVPENGQYTLRIEKLKPLFVTPGTLYCFGRLYININGVRYFLVLFGQGWAGWGEINWSHFYNFLAGDVIYFEAFFGDPAGFGFDTPVYFESGTLSASKYPQYQLGETVAWSEILPNDVTIGDLWFGLKHMFNLYAEIDNVKNTITIEPMFAWSEAYETGIGFIDETQSSIRLSTKVILNETATLQEFDDLAKEYVWGYAKDGRDGYLTKHEKENNIGLYQATYNFPERFQNTRTEDLNKTFSAITHAIIDGSAFPVIIGDVAANIADNYDDITTDFGKLKLLYFEGNTIGHWNFNGSDAGIYPKSYQLDVMGINNAAPSLTFDNHTISGNTYPGLFAKYWFRYFKCLEGRFYKKVTVQMTATEFANLTHRIVREMDGMNCILEDVSEFNPLSGNVASVTLRKITRPSEADETNIVSVGNPGVVVVDLPECFATLNVSCSIVTIVDNKFICFTFSITQSAGANATFSIWNGTAFVVPVVPMSPNICISPTCSMECSEPDVTIAIEPTNLIDTLTCGSLGGTEYELEFDWAGPPADAAVVYLIQEWYDNCNMLLVMEFYNSLQLKLFKSQITSFVVDTNGFSITYDTSLPIPGGCQTMKQGIVNGEIIPGFAGGGVGWGEPISVASLSCCTFVIDDNEVRVKLNSCEDKEQIYQILVTDTVDMCSNYIINQLPNG